MSACPPAPRRRNESGHLLLVGLPSSGKSSVAPLLGRALGVGWVDLDVEVERRCGATVPELFDRFGEPGFRERELATLEELLDGPGTVIATGGGVVTIRGARRLLGRHEVVWLRAEVGTVLERLSASAPTERSRPLLPGAGGPGLRRRVEELAEERNPLYAEVADLVVDVDDDDPPAVVRRILEYCGSGEGRGAPTT